MPKSLLLALFDGHERMTGSGSMAVGQERGRWKRKKKYSFLKKKFLIQVIVVFFFPVKVSGSFGGGSF